MTKTVRNTASATEDSFNKHYSTIWGEKRWQSSLYPALSQPTRYVALANNYVSSMESSQVLDAANGLNKLSLPLLPNASKDAPLELCCYTRSHRQGLEAGRIESFPPPQPAKSSPSRLLTHWNLDGASAFIAHLLDARPGHRVLDLCAAPGGKSIALAQKLWSELYVDARATPSGQQTSRFVANEADGRRQKRLLENLQTYLPPRLFQQGFVKAMRVDASQPGPGLNELLAGGGYDRVLVDAPCSSERHIIHAHLKAKASGNSAPEMSNWRPGSSKRLAKTQVDILMTALKAVKVGGVVMYATCSIEPTENDGVIEKMIALVEKERKKAGKWSVKVGFGDGEEREKMAEQLEQWAERTKYGWIVLPDHPGGGRWGPLFFARITKVDVG